MRIDHNTFLDVESISQNDVGGLAADAGQRHQFFHGARHLAAMIFDKLRAAGLDVFCFVAE